MRICKNKITDHIREQFRANPLKVPEARIQPMCMLEINENNQQYLGHFKYMVKGGFNHDIPTSTMPVAAVTDQRTTAVDANIGFGIMGNFLKALGADPASVTASLSKTKKMAFSFSNVRRIYIDPLYLGSILSQNELFADRDNFVLQPAMTKNNVRLGLITDIIISNNFSLSTFSESGANASIDVPAIANAIGNLNASLKVEKKSENEIKFEGPDDMTFAFTCLEIKIDPGSGKFTRGNWLENIKDARGVARTVESLQQGEEQLLERIVIDENEEYPLLIEM